MAQYLGNAMHHVHPHGPYHFIGYLSLFDPPISFIYGHVHRLTKKVTFLNKDAKYAKDINTDAKKKKNTIKKRETRQRKVG